MNKKMSLLNDAMKARLNSPARVSEVHMIIWGFLVRTLWLFSHRSGSGVGFLRDKGHSRALGIFMNKEVSHELRWGYHPDGRL